MERVEIKVNSYIEGYNIDEIIDQIKRWPPQSCNTPSFRRSTFMA